MMKSTQVNRHESGDLTISTIWCNDGDHLYETGIKHPDYNDGSWVIVEAYDTEESARDGHDKWMTTMIDPLPPELVDCHNAWTSKFVENRNFPRSQGTDVPKEK